ncbi:MAG: hypothetical protein Q9170_004747 [Blastenia crenularia]
MPTQEIIDLSLSTDDEGIKDVRITHGGFISAQTITAYVPVSGPRLDIDGGLRKKRKLSPPLSKHKKHGSIEIVSDVAGRLPSLPNIEANGPFLLSDDDDPIVWTSSPKQRLSALPVKARSDGRPWTSLLDSDDSLPDEQWLRTAQQRPIEASRTLQRFASLDRDRVTKSTDFLSQRKVKDRIDPMSTVKSHSQSSEDDVSSKARKIRTARKPKLTEEEKTARARERDDARMAAKLLKTKEKEDEKERKRLMKEEQTHEKQKERDRAEANKLKLDKKLSTPEMITDLPVSIAGQSVDTQIREVLKQLGVEVTSYQSPVPNLIKWRRKIESRFNVEKGCRERLLTKEIDCEKHVMCLMSATELAELVALDAEGGSESLDKHVSCIKSAFSDCIPIYMIEGLDAWIRKNRNARNRAYIAAVRADAEANGNESATTNSRAASKQKTQRTEAVDEDMMEDALLRLQIVNKCLVHHAAASVETAEWVAHFTEQISQIPYRHEQMARESTFCMDSGQVKSGKDAEEVYINMLLANVRVTAPIAYGIAARYPNVPALVRGLEEKGPTALENLKVRGPSIRTGA